MNFSQPSPDLLVPYLSAAAYQARTGIELSARSHWAIRAAVDQLVAQRDAQASAEGVDGRHGAAALAAAVEGRSNFLAESVLSVDADGRSAPDGSPSEAASQLDAVIDDLKAIAGSRPARGQAGERLGKRLDAIVASRLASAEGEELELGVSQA